MPGVSSRAWTPAARVTVAALLAVHAAVAWTMRVPGLATGHDDAWYVALGRALRHGSYVELPIVGHPAHAMYPPLYPALLGALGVIDPAHVWIGVLANMALSLVMLALVAGIAARLSPWLAVAVTLACAANPMLLYVASGIHSEPMLAAAAAVALSMTATRRRDAKALALIGLMAIAAALARSIGLALVVSTAALLAFERRWRPLAIFSVAAALTVGSWLAWTVRAPRLDAGRSYVADALYAPSDTSARGAALTDTSALHTPPRVASPEDVPSRAATATTPTTSSPPAPVAPAAPTNDSLRQRARTAPVVSEPTTQSAPRPATQPAVQPADQGADQNAHQGADQRADQPAADTAALDARRAEASREEAAAERVASARAAAIGRFIRTLSGRAYRNVPAYLTRELPTVFAIPTRPGTSADNLAWLAVFLVTALSGIVVLLRRNWLLVAYVAVSTGVLTLWPYVDKRFLAPLIPLVALAMLAGIWWIAERAAGLRVARLATLALSLLLAVFALRDDADRLARIAECDRGAPDTSPGCFNDEQRDFFAATAAARTLTPDTARFLVSKEATFFLLSDRQAVRESEAVAQRTPAALRAYLREHGVGYILLSRMHLDQWALASTLLPQCEALQLMRSFGAHTALLRLPPPTIDSMSAVPRVAAPDVAGARDASDALAPSIDAPTDTTAARNGCDAIARWNAGTWGTPPVRIW